MLTMTAALLVSILAQDEKDVDQWIEVLKGTLWDGRAVADPLPRNRARIRAGWRRMGWSHIVLERFDKMTTAQARLAVPKLIGLLDDGTVIDGDPTDHVRDLVCERAQEALVRISFRRFGGFERSQDVFGLDALKEKKESPAQEAKRLWPEWWQKNRDREIDVWRREALDDLMKAVRARTSDAAAATAAVAALTDLLPAAQKYLKKDETDELLAMARGKDAAGRLRFEAILCVADLRLAPVEETLLAMMADDTEDAGIRAECLPKVTLPRSAAPQLLALARRQAQAQEGALAPKSAPAFIYGATIHALNLMLELRQPYSSPTREERLKVVDWCEQTWKKQGDK